jgi:hypothetical protein
MRISTHVAELDASPASSRESSIFGTLLRSVPGDERRRVFREWLTLSLELQLADLEELLSSLPRDQRTSLQGRLAEGFYSELVPSDAPAPHRLLFQSDLETILTLREMC